MGSIYNKYVKLKEKDDKYLELFENLNLKVKVVESNSIDKYLSIIKELDINNISYEESKDILFNIKELL